MCMNRSQSEMTRDLPTRFFTDGKGNVVTEHEDNDGSWGNCLSPDCHNWTGWTFDEDKREQRVAGMKQHPTLRDAQVAASYERLEEAQRAVAELEAEGYPSLRSYPIVAGVRR